MENQANGDGIHRAIEAGTVDPLTEVRRRADYSPAEREFSVLLQQRFRDLLEGKRNSLDLLRKYPGEPNRLGVVQLPPGVRRDALRLSVAEDLTWRIIEFMRSADACGPIVQQRRQDGTLIEQQSFPTKYPHIVIERTDRFPDGSVEPTEITWALRRVQNQRAQTQLNRFLDAANLAFELFRIVR